MLGFKISEMKRDIKAGFDAVEGKYKGEGEDDLE